MPKKSPRHLARSLAIQGIYFHKMNNTNLDDIEIFLSNNEYLQWRDINDPQNLDEDGVSKSNNELTIHQVANHELLHFLLERGIRHYDAMLELYTPYLNRNISDINLIEQIILVIAAIEFKENLSVPVPVIINEAVELAKLYGAEESYKFINGLVDKLSSQLR